LNSISFDYIFPITISLGKNQNQLLTSKHIDQESLASLIKSDLNIGLWPIEMSAFYQYVLPLSADTVEKLINLKMLKSAKSHYLRKY